MFSSGKSKAKRKQLDLKEIKKIYNEKKVLKKLIGVILENKKKVIEKVVFSAVSEQELRDMFEDMSNSDCYEYDTLSYEYSRRSYLHHYRAVQISFFEEFGI